MNEADPEFPLDAWEVQLRKGALELAILLALAGREQYGFELVEGIARRAALPVPEGTLYPLLLRLQRDALVDWRLGPGDGGAPRKYYRLSAKGTAVLGAMRGRWRALTTAIARLEETSQ